MEIIVRKAELVRELHLVQGIVERKSSIPILSNVLAEARDGHLHLAATDLDVSLRGGCPAQVVSPGAITLAAKKLFEIARALPEADVRLKSLPDAWASIECERVSFKVAGLPREEFPALPQGKEGPGVRLPADVVRDLVGRTSFAITTEDARYYLAGALLLIEPEGVAMVATDGHRLAFVRRQAAVEVTAPQRVIVPKKAVFELTRLLEGEETIELQEAENHLVFQVGGRTLSSKTIEGQFPAFEKVLGGAGDKHVTLGRELLAGAVRRVSLLSSERSRAVRVALAEGRLEITASSPEMGEARESLPVEYAGEPVEIGFNAQYLQEFLGVVRTDEVQLTLKDAESQGQLRPVGEEGIDHRYVVMPMRL